MSNSNDSRFENVYSKKVKAGSRRTYFFDVRKTRGEDYYITLTESTKKHNSDNYERHKIFLYKEDFNRFLTSLQEVVDYVKVDLMPNYDYEEFDRKQAEWEANNQNHPEGQEGHEGRESSGDSDEIAW
ncbi:MAG TPA: DUF3276 family protein [Saprospiraceae bacterium]|nr:DUF3276 family protein [Saprospiraceae bacterium]